MLLFLEKTVQAQCTWNRVGVADVGWGSGDLVLDAKDNDELLGDVKWAEPSWKFLEYFLWLQCKERRVTWFGGIPWGHCWNKCEWGGGIDLSYEI